MYVLHLTGSLSCLPQAGTVIYIAPEVLRNKYTLSADLWSVGIIAYLLLTGRLPFAGEEGEEVSDLFMRKQIFQNRVRPSFIGFETHCGGAVVQGKGHCSTLASALPVQCRAAAPGG